MSKPAPCKFCDEDKSLVVDYYQFDSLHCAVTCHTCWARGPLIDCVKNDDPEESAIAAWNKERTCRRVHTYRNHRHVTECSECGAGLGSICVYCHTCGRKVTEN